MHNSETLEAAYRVLEQAKVLYQGEPVGNIASNDPNAPAENYADCFVRDFVPSAFVYLLDGEPQIVRNFLSLILKLRDQQEEQEGHQLLPRVMPASFKVLFREDGGQEVHADFGDRAIGRVAPVDSMMWWVLLLYAYVRITGDVAFSRSPEVQRGIRLIVSICLRDHFEVFPTLLVPDGSFMIDRRMGVYGHPLEIQSLFYGVLNAARDLLVETDPECQPLLAQMEKRLELLTDYVRRYYWLDMQRLNEIHRYETEKFGIDALNQLNIYPESIPDWVMGWLPDEAGYLVGNLGPSRMDFRFFSQGNLLAVLFGLADVTQSKLIVEVFARRWDELVGEMPVKICYPAMQGLEWQLNTGSDPKNSAWSYHNGGNWPTLLWPFVAAVLSSGRGDLAERALDIAARRLPAEGWPEYYDGRSGRLLGRRANYNQTWSAAAVILAHKFLEDPGCIAELGLHRREPFQ